MLFNSTQYLLFLPLVVLIYATLSPRHRRVLILVASYYFYAAANWRLLGLLILSTLVNYNLGLLIASTRRPATRKFWLIATVVLNLSVLSLFKYANWSGDLTRHLFGHRLWPALNWPLPLGISFYTFEVISYVVDEYRGVTRPIRSLMDMALYVSFFPHLIAGPIIRANDLVPQLACDQPVVGEQITEGIVRLIWGMLKKVFVADVMGHLVEEAYSAPNSYSGTGLILATYAFAVQIYCDFSAYSDMALGSALMLGIRLPENFDKPYLSCGIREFWRRWHISLSNWLRDYLYIPLGGSRRGRARTYLNLIFTMMLGGLWHGAGWAWIAWGSFHGAMMSIERALGVGDRPPPQAGWRWCRRLITFHLICLSWILFRAKDLTIARGIYERIFTLAPGDIHMSYAPVIYLAILIATESLNCRQRISRGLLARPTVTRWVAYGSVALFVFTFGRSGPAEFIYFQF